MCQCSCALRWKRALIWSKLRILSLELNRKPLSSQLKHSRANGAVQCQTIIHKVLPRKTLHQCVWAFSSLCQKRKSLCNTAWIWLEKWPFEDRQQCCYVKHFYEGEIFKSVHTNQRLVTIFFNSLKHSRIFFFVGWKSFSTHFWNGVHQTLDNQLPTQS